MWRIVVDIDVSSGGIGVYVDFRRLLVDNNVQSHRQIINATDCRTILFNVSIHPTVSCVTTSFCIYG